MNCVDNEQVELPESFCFEKMPGNKASASAAVGCPAHALKVPTKEKPHRKNKKKVIPLDVQEEMLNNEFPHLSPGHEIPVLTDAELHKLIVATHSFEKQRIEKIITALQEQLQEHQDMLDRLHESEQIRKQLVARNEFLEKERMEQEMRISLLEHEVIELKLNLATEKTAVDHSHLSVSRLTVKLRQVQSENDLLHEKLTSSIRSVDGSYVESATPVVNARNDEVGPLMMGEMLSKYDVSDHDGSLLTPAAIGTEVGTAPTTYCIPTENSKKGKFSFFETCSLRHKEMKSSIDICSSVSRAERGHKLSAISASFEPAMKRCNIIRRHGTRHFKHSSLTLNESEYFKNQSFGSNFFSVVKDWMGSRNTGEQGNKDTS